MSGRPISVSVSRRAVLAAGLSALAPNVLRAQAWPSGPLRIIVPFTPGGSTDLLARVIGEKLAPVLGQPVIVDNRPGAGGSIGATLAARASDNHTLMMGHIGTLAFNPSLYPDLGYDPLKDFVPVALVATVPNILVINPSVPATTVAEFIAHGRQKPRSLHYGSGGNGSAAHVAGAYFAFAAGIEAVHVPYRGTAPSVTDLLAGQIQFTLTGGPAVLPHVATGRLRALAVSSAERVRFAPQLPSLAEAALPGFEAVQWYGLVAPRNFDASLVERLNQEVNRHLTSPEVAVVLEKDGAIAAPRSPQAFGALIASEIALWRGVIQKAGIVLG